MNRFTPNFFLKILEFAHYGLRFIGVPYFFYSIYKAAYPILIIFAFDDDSGLWFWILLVWLMAILLSISIVILFSARYIDKHINYTYSVVVACLECFIIPYGFDVGIATLILLSQPSIKSLYNIDLNIYIVYYLFIVNKSIHLPFSIASKKYLCQNYKLRSQHS